MSSRVAVFFLSVAVPMIGLGVTSGCTRSGPAPVTRPLRIQLTAEPASLDPTLAEDGISLKILANLHDGLVGYDGAGALENRLAQSVRVSPDGLTYEFAIREGAAWSDGAPVRPEDFVTAIRRATAPGAGAKLAGSLYVIRGAREGKPAVLARGRDLVIELSEPAPYFLGVLTLPLALPQREDVLAGARGRWPESAPTTGPYVLRRHDAERGLTLARNPRYWRARDEAPAEVEWVIVGDGATAMNLFERGQLDVVTSVSSEDLRRLKPANHVRAEYGATFYVAFNWRKAPFDDRRWRQAVSASISRAEITQALGGGERPARGWIPPGLEGAIPSDLPWPEAWRESVSWVHERSVAIKARPLKTLFDSSARNSLIMEKIQADLKSKLGMRLALSHHDWKSFLRSVQTDPPEIFRLGILAPFRDPIQILTSFTSNDPNNYLKWSNSRFDTLVTDIGKLPPSPARAEKIRAAQSILVDEEAIVAPIYHYTQNLAVSERVGSFRINSLGIVRFDELRLLR